MTKFPLWPWLVRPPLLNFFSYLHIYLLQYILYAIAQIIFLHGHFYHAMLSFCLHDKYKKPIALIWFQFSPQLGSNSLLKPYHTLWLNPECGTWTQHSTFLSSLWQTSLKTIFKNLSGYTIFSTSFWLLILMSKMHTYIIHPKLWQLTYNAPHYPKCPLSPEWGWNSTHQILHWLPYIS